MKLDKYLMSESPLRWKNGSRESADYTDMIQNMNDKMHDFIEYVGYFQAYWSKTEDDDFNKTVHKDFQSLNTDASKIQNDLYKLRDKYKKIGYVK